MNLNHMLDYKDIRRLIWESGLLPDASKCPEDMRIVIEELNKHYATIDALYGYLDVLLDEKGAPKENTWDIPQGGD